MKYTKDMLESAAKVSTSVAGVMRELGANPTGGHHTHISRRLKTLGIDTSHFTGQGHTKGGKAYNRKTAEEILVVLAEGSPRPKAHQLRRALVESGIPVVCSCGIGDMWNGKPIQLEVDHIDGDWYNNLIDNLRFLCPNCHSQEPTNRGWRK